MNRVAIAYLGAALATACLAAPEANPTKSMQIAAERLGGKNAFEVARAVTEAKVWTGADGGTLPYRLHVPSPFAPGRRYPMVVHMHGAGSRGTNNLDQIRTGGADFISCTTFGRRPLATRRFSNGFLRSERREIDNERVSG